MKKIISVLICAALLSACQKKSIENIPVSQIPVKDQNVFTSIKDAVTKQIVLKCEYNDEDSKVITYIKGNVVRFQGTGKEASVSGLIKDGKYYLWEDNGKEGLILDIAKLAADGSMKMGNTVIKNEDDVIAKLEEEKQNCQVSPASASLMELPAGIKFSEGPSFFQGGSDNK